MAKKHDSAAKGEPQSPPAAAIPDFADGGSLSSKPPERVKELRAAEPDKEAAKRGAEAQARTEAITSRLQGESIPDSMRHYILTQQPPDDQIDAMLTAWKEERVVRHGSAQWGEAKPKE